MVVVDGQGVPVGIHVTSASPGEITLLEPTLNTVRPRGRLTTLIADRAYDSDRKRADLARRGITLIAPYRSHCVNRRFEDGRRFRRYRHRWIVERTMAWLGSFRRLLVRHERLTSMYCSFLYIAAALITLRRF